jgi:hypothetical protein
VAVVVGFDQGNKVLLASMDGALNEETLGATWLVARLSSKVNLGLQTFLFLCR